jgi:large subunit ribosomal protein L29
MKASELRDLATDVLQKRLNDAREELMKLRFQQASGQLTDTSRLSQIRRDIARMTMVLDDRQREQQTEGEK